LPGTLILGDSAQVYLTKKESACGPGYALMSGQVIGRSAGAANRHSNDRTRDPVRASRPTGWYFYPLLFLAVWFACAWNPMPIDVGGDIERKWTFVRHLLDPAWPNWTLDHHTGRWAINLPTAVAAWIFGTSPAAITVSQ